MSCRTIPYSDIIHDLSLSQQHQSTPNQRSPYPANHPFAYTSAEVTSNPEITQAKKKTDTHTAPKNAATVHGMRRITNPKTPIFPNTLSAVETVGWAEIHSLDLNDIHSAVISFRYKKTAKMIQPRGNNPHLKSPPGHNHSSNILSPPTKAGNPKITSRFFLHICSPSCPRHHTSFLPPYFLPVSEVFVSPVMRARAIRFPKLNHFFQCLFFAIIA